MKTLSDTPHGVRPGRRGRAAAAVSRTRPFYWSVRRELWENRSIYLAPLGVASFVVVGLVVHAVTMPSHLPGMLGTDPASSGSPGYMYVLAAMLLILTSVLVGAFYCLDALSSERRDRSILFWKSMPVSDLTTVLSKIVIPLMVLPLLTFAALVALLGTMMLLSAAALVVQGEPVAPVWEEVQLFRLTVGLLYALVVMVLWHAPIYGFLLLVSGWARRTAALWALLPPLAVGALEKLAMDTSRVAALGRYRLLGWHAEAFTGQGRAGIPVDPLLSPTPERFFGAPGLWIGLAFAAAFVAAAVWLRRNRDPI